jgi:hypothetical protein
MAGPMPPPPGPEEAPVEEAPAEGGGGGDLASLLQNLAQGITILEETVVGSGVMPEIGQRISAIKQELMGVVDQISKGGGGAPQQAASPAPMEAGPGGVPSTPAMR